MQQRRWDYENRSSNNNNNAAEIPAVDDDVLSVGSAVTVMSTDSVQPSVVARRLSFTKTSSAASMASKFKQQQMICLRCATRGEDGDDFDIEQEHRHERRNRNFLLEEFKEEQSIFMLETRDAQNQKNASARIMGGNNNKIHHKVAAADNTSEIPARPRRLRLESRRRSCGDEPAPSTWQSRLWANLQYPEVARREQNRRETSRLAASVKEEIERTGNTALVFKKLQTFLGEDLAAAEKNSRPVRKTLASERRSIAASTRVMAVKTDSLSSLHNGMSTYRPRAPSYNPATPPAPMRKSIRDQPIKTASLQPERTPTPLSRAASPMARAVVGSLVRTYACERLIVTPGSSRASSPRPMTPDQELPMDFAKENNSPRAINLSLTPKPPAHPRSADKREGFNASVHVSRKIVRI